MIGTEFSHYRVEERLGVGGMGVVYKGWDTLVGRPVALKFLHPDREGDGAKARESLLREARAAMSVVHQNVCPVYGVEELPDGQLCIAMGFCEGSSLESTLRENAIARADALRVAAEITAGLAAAHAVDVVHRDIKPSNVLTTAQGSVRLVDFGLARHGTTIREGAGHSLAGTPLYMAPEVLAGSVASPQADVFSLGVLLWRLFTGVHPFGGESDPRLFARIAHEDPELPAAVADFLPEELVELLRWMVEKDPSRRPANAGAVLAPLRELYRDAERASSDATQPFPVGASRPYVRSRRRALYWSVAVIVVATGSWFLSRTVSTPTSIGLAFVAPHEGSETLLAEGLATRLSWEIADLCTGRSTVWIVPFEWIDEVEVWSARGANHRLGVDAVVSIQPAGDRGILLSLHEEGATEPVARRFEDSPGTQTVVATLREWGLPLPLRASITSAACADLDRGLAHLRRQTADGDSAVSLLERAVCANEPIARSVLAAALSTRFEIRREERDAQRSAAILDSLIEAGSLPARARILRAHLALRCGEARDAARWLTEARRFSSADFQLLRYLAWAYAVEGEVGMAEQVQREMVQALPRFVGSHERMGLFHFTHGQVQQAWDSFLRASRLAPDYAYTFNLLGACAVKLGCWDQAVELFEHALRFGRSSDATANLGFQYYYRGQYEDAIAMYRWAVRASPADHQLVGALGASLWWSGSRDEARALFPRAVELAEPLLATTPTPSLLWLDLAGYYSYFDPIRAREALARGLQDLPEDSGDGRLKAASVYVALGDTESALEDLRRAVALGVHPRLVEGSPFLQTLHELPGYRHLVAETEAVDLPCPELPAFSSTALSPTERVP